MIDTSRRWPKSATAFAVALVSLWVSNAAALSLGRVVVLSALGEPLRAELDIPVINAEESGSLVVNFASPDAFRAAGMEYSATLSGAQITLLKRSDGRSFLRLSSERPVNEPFMDVILDATWSTGRIVRDFTLLFDPPSLRQSAAPGAAQLPAAPAAVRLTPASPTPPETPTPATAPQANAGKGGSAPAPAPAPAPLPATTPVPVTATATEKPAAVQVAPRQAVVKVKSGDTAGKIAATHRAMNVSLDQMLVALLRSNPQAFVRNDINRIKAGAVLDIPDAAAAQAVPLGEARQILLAQSKDFNDYRRQAAVNAPLTLQAPADRQASGPVQARVEDAKPGAGAPDKLTLSKGKVQSGVKEAQLAQERSLKEAADRAAELARNIDELSKLGATSGASASAPSASSPASATTSPAPAPTAVSSAPSVRAALTVAEKPKPAASQSAEASSLLQSLTENPLAPAWAAGLIALLGALGIYRMRQRRKLVAQEDSSFLASRLKPDSFFSANGASNPDATEDPATGSSLLNPSSLARAAGESDPLAEAEVYLAYGREAQAEEVLRDAIRNGSELPGLHQKLLEILAKRRDSVGFEEIARQVRELTHGEGPEWQRIADLGLALDPANRLYRADSAPIELDFPEQIDTLSTPVTTAVKSAVVDLDLDLDFSLNDDVAPAARLTDTHPSLALAPEGGETEPMAIPGAQPEQDFATEPALTTDLEFDLDLGSGQIEPVMETTPTPASDADFDPPGLTLEGLAPSSPSPMPTGAGGQDAEPAEESPTTNPGLLEFDFGSLSLELEDDKTASREVSASGAEDPLATKLALAQEFSAIGDQEGARALLEEVMLEGSGELQAKAQEALDKL